MNETTKLYQITSADCSWHIAAKSRPSALRQLRNITTDEKFEISECDGRMVLAVNVEGKNSNPVVHRVSTWLKEMQKPGILCSSEY